MLAAGTIKPKRTELILLFHRPMSPTELKKMSGYGMNYISYKIKKYHQKGLIRRLSTSHTGKIYGLTRKGMHYRNIVLKDNDLNIFGSYNEPSNVDWRLYGWLISSKAKKDYLKIMAETEKRLNTPFKASHVFLRYRYEGIKATPRTEVYRALWAFIGKGIVKRISDGKRGVKYMLTSKGRAICSML